MLDNLYVLYQIISMIYTSYFLCSIPDIFYALYQVISMFYTSNLSLSLSTRQRSARALWALYCGPCERLYIPGLSSPTSYLVHGKGGEDTEGYMVERYLQEGTKALRFLIYLPTRFNLLFLVWDPWFGYLSGSMGEGNSLYAMLQGRHCLGHNEPLLKEVKTRTSRCLWYPTF